MIGIPQHGENREFYDIRTFLPVLEKLLVIRKCTYAVDQCTGDGALEIEKSASMPVTVDFQDFKEVYKGVYQTIDGEFTFFADGGTVKIAVFDSSFWEIESNIPGVEEEFSRAFITYEDACAAQNTNRVTQEIAEFTWKFIRGDIPHSDFEERLYSDPVFEEIFGEELYTLAIETIFSDKKATYNLRAKLAAHLHSKFPSDCYCVRLKNLAVVTMGNYYNLPAFPSDHDWSSDDIFKNLEEIKKRGEPFWWLWAARCKVCRQGWLIGSEERIYEDYCMLRLDTEQVSQITNNNIWPHDFDSYETLLQLSKSSGSVSYVDPLYSTTIKDTVSNLVQRRPDINASELAELLSLNPEMAKQLLGTVSVSTAHIASYNHQRFDEQTLKDLGQFLSMPDARWRGKQVNPDGSEWSTQFIKVELRFIGGKNWPCALFEVYLNDLKFEWSLPFPFEDVWKAQREGWFLGELQKRVSDRLPYIKNLDFSSPQPFAQIGQWKATHTSRFEDDASSLRFNLTVIKKDGTSVSFDTAIARPGTQNWEVEKKAAATRLSKWLKKKMG